MGGIPSRVLPWIDVRSGQRMGTSQAQRWDKDRRRNEYCPECRSPLTKVQQYFDFDTGRWTRFRQCYKCGVKVTEQSLNNVPESLLKF